MTKKTVVAVCGLVDGGVNTNNLVEAKDALRSLPNISVLGVKKYLDDINNHNYLGCRDDIGDTLDNFFEKSVEAVDKADALVIVAPDPVAVGNPDFKNDFFSEGMLKLNVGYLGWAGFLSGYAWSVGKPSILYNPYNTNLFLYAPLARALHATVYTLDKLIGYDWDTLPYGVKGEVY